MVRSSLVAICLLGMMYSASAQWQMFCTIPDAYGDTHWDRTRNTVFTFGRSYNSFASPDSGATWDILPMNGLELFDNQSITQTFLGENGHIYMRLTVYGKGRVNYVSADGGISFRRYVQNHDQSADPANNDYDYGFASASLCLVQPNRLFLRSPGLSRKTVYWSEDDGQTFNVIGPDPGVTSTLTPNVIEISKGVAGIPTDGHWSEFAPDHDTLIPTNVPIEIDEWARTKRGTLMGYRRGAQVVIRTQTDTALRVYAFPDPKIIGGKWPSGVSVGRVNDSVLALVARDGNVFLLSDADSVPRHVFDPKLDRTRQLSWAWIDSSGVYVRYELPWAPQDERMHIVVINEQGQIVRRSTSPGRSTNQGILSYETTKHAFVPITWDRIVHYQWTSTNTGATWWAKQRKEAVDSVFNRNPYKLVGHTPKGGVLFSDVYHGSLYHVLGDTIHYVNSNTAAVTYERTPGARSSSERTLSYIEGVPHIDLNEESIWIGGDVVSRWSHDFTLIDTVMRKRCLVIDRGSNGLAYAGTDTVYRTSDGGRTWHSRMSTKDLVPTNAWYTKVADIAHQGNDTVVVGLAGSTKQISEETRLVSLGGIWSSVDGGMTWTRSEEIDSTSLVVQIESLGDGVFIALIRKLNFQQREDTAIAHSYMTWSASHIWRSSDGGRTWTVVLSGFETLDRQYNDGVIDISMHVQGDSVWYANPQRGIYLSSDRGRTFNAIDATLDIRPTSILSMNDGSIITAGKGGLYRLADPKILETTSVQDADFLNERITIRGTKLIVDEAFVGGRVVAYDVTGREVWRSASIGYEVDLSGLTFGTYFIVVVERAGLRRTTGLYLPTQ